MLRRATFSDIPAMDKLVRWAHRMSAYADRVAINDKALEQTLMGLVAGQNQNGPCASHVTVVEHQGKVTGFIAGSLSRVYNVGDKLVASDVFLINRGGKASDTLKMIDEYIAWASSNPKVIEVGLSWTEALPGGFTLAKIYTRKGFAVFGEQYVLRLDIAKREAA